MAISAYKILKEANEANLAEAVTTAIGEGWEPFGPLFLDGKFVCQPMIQGAAVGSGDLLTATAGTVTASKAVVVDASKNASEFGTLGAATYQQDGVTLSAFKWVTKTVTAALLDSAGSVSVIAGVTGDQYKIREIRLVGGGTNFDAGGDRDISLTDGTTTWTTIANADIESAPSATLTWGDTKVPFLTGTSDTASASNAAIVWKYTGGTTDHSATGSIKFDVLLEKVA